MGITVRIFGSRLLEFFFLGRVKAACSKNLLGVSIHRFIGGSIYLDATNLQYNLQDECQCIGGEKTLAICGLLVTVGWYIQDDFT